MVSTTTKNDLLTELFLETFRLSGGLDEMTNQLAKREGLTRARWQVLLALHLEGRPITVAQLGRRMGLSRQAVQRIVNVLVKAEILKVGPNADHKRSSLVTASAKGEMLLQRIESARTEWVNRVSNEFSEPTLEQAHKVLGLVCEEVVNL